MGPGTLCVFLRENYVMQNTVKVLKLIINPTTMSDDLINQLMSDIMEEEFNFILEWHNQYFSIRTRLIDTTHA